MFENIVDSFLTAAKINGESGNEKDVVIYIKKKFEELNIDLVEDNAGKAFGGNAGNLIGYYPGTIKEASPILIAAHMDTIEPTTNLNPIIKDKIIKSDGKTILGADDRVGISVLLEVMAYIINNKVPSGPIFLAFTVAEEIGMYGSGNLSREKLKAKFGFVFDSSANPGDIIISAPSSTKLIIKIIGKAAHAAVQPEDGINSIKIAADAINKIDTGRITKTCTVNFGIISGGKAINIVPDSVVIEGEVRSFDENEAQQMIKNIHSIFEASSKNFGGKIVFETFQKYKSFNLPSDSDAVEIAKIGIAAAGYNAIIIQYPGGSDANKINELGIPTVNLGLGYRNVHTHKEFVSIKNLKASANIALSICKTAAVYNNKIEKVLPEGQ